jgi:hypothetical protein
LTAAAVVIATVMAQTSLVRAAGGLTLDYEIPLGNVSGRIDHMDIDLRRGRLFVAELGNDSVGIVDLTSRKIIHRITGLSEPQGVGYVANVDSLYVANGGDGSVRVFRGTDYAEIGRIELGADADNVRVDAAAGQVLVGFGGGGIAVIDAVQNRKIEEWRLPAHPEGFQIDHQAGVIFVNVPQASALIGLDSKTGRQQSRWKVPYSGNFSLALDANAQRILVAFRKPAKLVSYDIRSGSIVSEAEICGDADDVFLQAPSGHIYITCGAGKIDVLREDGSGLEALGRLQTVSGARTGLLVPQLQDLFLGVRRRWNRPPSVRVYRLQD